MIKLKKVVETAKLYYKDPKALEQSIKDILEDQLWHENIDQMKYIH